MNVLVLAYLLRLPATSTTNMGAAGVRDDDSGLH